MPYVYMFKKITISVPKTNFMIEQRNLSEINGMVECAIGDAYTKPGRVGNSLNYIYFNPKKTGHEWIYTGYINAQLRSLMPAAIRRSSVPD